MICTRGSQSKAKKYRYKQNLPVVPTPDWLPPIQVLIQDRTQRWRQSRTRGGRIALVGGGKSTRWPSCKSSGLYSSGTELCMTGLLRYCSMCVCRPWFGSHHVTKHTFLLGTVQFEKPSKTLQKRCATLGCAMFTKAYPNAAFVLKSIGKYKKSYASPKPSLCSNSTSMSLV